MNRICFFCFGSVLMFLHLIRAQHSLYDNVDHPTANLSTTWTNNDSDPLKIQTGSYPNSRLILLRQGFGSKFGCGFYCNGDCQTYLFGIFIMGKNGSMPMIWSANRNNPVKLNATLQLTREGDLELRDVDGTLAWSTNTSHKYVTGLNLTEDGNLVLFDVNNSIIWQSFDHPTDTLVLGQSLIVGQKLISSISDTNLTQGLYSFSVKNYSIVAAIESNPPQLYLNLFFALGEESNKQVFYLKFQNGSLQTPSNEFADIPQAFGAQYMRLMSNGHLKVFENGKQVADVFPEWLVDECKYPMVCGKYSICSKGQCSCPRSRDFKEYFIPVNNWQPNLGCSAITPVTCNASRYHRLVELENVTYFAHNLDTSYTSIDHCREACLSNCSCKAAFFYYGLNSSIGSCRFASEIFSLMANKEDKRCISFLKVQTVPSSLASPPESRRENNNHKMIWDWLQAVSLY